MVMIDTQKKPVHYAWGKFFNRFGPYIHTQLWEKDGYDLTPPHSHEFMEIFIVAGGSVSHQTIHGTAILRKGEGLFLRPGAWHAIGRANNLIASNLCFIESAIHSYVPLLATSPILNNLFLTAPMSSKGALRFKLNTDEMSRLIPRLKLLNNMEDSNDISVTVEKIGLFVSCLGLIANTVYSSRQNTNENTICISSRRAIDLIESNTAYPWSLDRVAKKLNINKFYLARLFRKDTGMTVVDFITRKRAETAATLLINTDKPISEIASITGWKNPNYFARRFRKFYGISATVYRENTKLL